MKSAKKLKTDGEENQAGEGQVEAGGTEDEQLQQMVRLLQEKGKKLLDLSMAGDLDKVKEALKDGPHDLGYHDDEGKTALMIAAEKGHKEVVLSLLGAGAPWNSVDNNGKSVGEYAKENGHDALYNELVAHGCRTELLLGLMQRKEDKGKDGKDSSVPNTDYLKQKLRYEDGKLMDEDNDAVMMGWEAPLMKLHAEVICRNGGSVLNVGFGLGIIDEEIQKRNPTKHTIIEAHPDVYQHMLDQGWDKKPNVRILFGRWQDVIEDLEVYDGIFFDTYGEYYQDQRQFHELVPNILEEGGVFSFFNGFAATNPFFHDVYCDIASLELNDMGLSTMYTPVPIDPLSDEWEGVRQKYWSLKTYMLPECRFAL